MGYPVLGNLSIGRLVQKYIYHNNNSYTRLCIGSEYDSIYERVIPYNESPLQTCPPLHVQTLGLAQLCVT